MVLGQSISFGDSLDFCLGEVKEILQFFFEEEKFLNGSSSIDLDHLADEQMFYLGPSVHMFGSSHFISQSSSRWKTHCSP
jgi:hypothetical protein